MAHAGLMLDGAADPPREQAEVAGVPDIADPHARLRTLVDVHHAFIWRSLRRLGVAPGDVDDGVQKVFLTASRKLAHIVPGAEKSFLFQTALRVAADSRRTVRRRREVGGVAGAGDDAAGFDEPSAHPDTERMIDLRRARAQLDAILDAMPIDLRAVFVLYELDEMPSAEIAALLEVPPGTVSSRLRRARAAFSVQVARLHRQEASPRGVPR
jgi:RNA polymerase sigma-70 factor (ECF subfamily)